MVVKENGCGMSGDGSGLIKNGCGMSRGGHGMIRNECTCGMSGGGRGVGGAWGGGIWY